MSRAAAALAPPTEVQHLCVLLICCFSFILICLQSQKYCSFKYCALHRIFSHKLVNIYISSQYSDINFHIYTTIKCCFFISFLFLFRFSVVFLEKSLRMFLDGCQVFSPASAALPQGVLYLFARFVFCRQKTKTKKGLQQNKHSKAPPKKPISPTRRSSSSPTVGGGVGGGAWEGRKAGVPV